MQGRNGEEWGVCLDGDEILVYSGSCGAPTSEERYVIPQTITLTGFTNILFNARGETSQPTTITLQNTMQSVDIQVQSNGVLSIAAVITPTVAPTATLTPTPTISLTSSPTPTSVATSTPTVAPTATTIPSPTPTPYDVIAFVLINAVTDTDIGPLTDGMILNLSTLPTTSLSVRAETDPSPVGSVVFGYDSNPSLQTENILPYAIAGDNSGDYNPWTPTVGPHTLTATPYTGSGGSGIPGTALTVNFTVINATPTPGPTSTPTLTPTPVPSQLTATLTQTSSWATGYCVDITINNTSPSAVNGWTLTITRNSYTIYNSWNGNFTANTGNYVITPLSWNSSVPANGSVGSLGFCANTTSGYVFPTVISVN